MSVLEIAAMPVLNHAIKDSILIAAPNQPLKEIIVLMGKLEIEEFSPNKVMLPRDCVLILKNSQLLGIFTQRDLVRLIASGMDLTEVKIAEVMRKPLIVLGEDFDVNVAFSLMRQHGVSHLPIVDDALNLLGIVTPESIALELQAELSKTKEQLQTEIAQRGFLEFALEKTENELERRMQEVTADLVKTNKLLQRKICDRIATEAQLLQTISEFQELFEAFPDIYFRLKNDGTILSGHARETSDLCLPLEEFMGKRGQDVLPSDVAKEFEQAILQLKQTDSLVAIEYSLLMLNGGEKIFEARLLPTIQHQIIVIIRNITERKQAQKALQKAKNELEIRVEERTYELRNTNDRLRQEIIERQRIEEALRYRVEFEKLITTISTHFINLATEHIDNGINQALQSIAEFANIDRSYIFLFDDNYIQINNIYEWCVQDFEEIIHYPNPKDNLIEFFPWILEKLRCFESIYITHVSDLFSEAKFESQSLFTRNIQSLIILPIVCSGSLIGYLEFDSVRSTKNWTEESIALLKMVGEILGNTLERKRVEQALRVSEERYVRAINAGKVGIWEWNIQTNDIYVDPNLKAMLGYGDREFSNNFHDWLGFIHPDDISSVKVEINAYLEGVIQKYEIEHRMLHKDGSNLWFLARGTVIRNENGEPCYIAGSNTDITDRKQTENKLKASLKEKEVLLKEIHHRVKNNLQVISSLLRLQAGYIKDEQALESFRDSQNRVRAMALIHENLYQSNDLARIQFSDYIQKLTNNLLRSYGVNRDIKIHLNIDKILLRIDSAIPCGLIINELVSNSIKHAFIAGSQGKIYVDFLELGHSKYSLTVSDNGVGVPDDIELRRNQSLGLQLVWNLVEQLEGSIAFNTKLGILFKITFVEQN
jgi:PAS domain S-box-containing protein